MNPTHADVFVAGQDGVHPALVSMVSWFLASCSQYFPYALTLMGLAPSALTSAHSGAWSGRPGMCRPRADGIHHRVVPLQFPRLRLVGVPLFCFGI